MNRVILSSKIIIGDGTFETRLITEAQAQEWLKDGPFQNFSGHETVRILGLKPDKSRKTCDGYDQALVIVAKARLEFGREYSLSEIKKIGMEFSLISRIVSVQDILDLAAKLPSGLNDPLAAEKMLAERAELLEAIEQKGDSLGEAADAAYYAAKHIDYVAGLLGISVDDVFQVAQAKYALRAQSDNPKDFAAEREAVQKVIR